MNKKQEYNDIVPSSRKEISMGYKVSNNKKEIIFSCYLVLVAVLWIIYKDSYFLNMLVLIAINGIIVLGLDVTTGFTGQLNLGQNGFVIFGAYISSLLVTKTGFPMIVSTLVALLISVIVAYLLAVIIVGMGELYLAIATLVFGSIIYNLVVGAYSLTGGGLGVFNIPSLSIGSYQFSKNAYFFLTWILFGVFVYFHQNLWNSRVGLGMRAIKIDPLAAQSVGIDIKKLKIQAVLISASLGSVGGSLTAFYLKFVNPEMFNLGKAVEYLLMAFLGGLGTGWGSLLGSGLIIGLPNIFEFLKDYKTLMYSIIFALVLVLLPKGIGGLFSQIIRYLSNKFRSCFSQDTRATEVLSNVNQPGQRQLAHTWLSTLVKDDGSVTGSIFKLEGIRKSFGGLSALQKIDLEINEKTITSIIGPNGAGKTTLLNIFAGYVTPTNGEVIFRNENITRLLPHQIVARGIYRTFQTPRVFGDLTVTENIVSGRYAKMHHGIFAGCIWNKLANSEMEKTKIKARELQDFFGLTGYDNVKADKLPLGKQKMLELARVLMGEPSVILLDEPAAGLNDAETDLLGQTLVQIKKLGITVIIVEHDMGLVLEISDHVFCINDGVVIAGGSSEDVQNNINVRKAYLGEDF